MRRLPSQRLAKPLEHYDYGQIFNLEHSLICYYSLNFCTTKMDLVISFLANFSCCQRDGKNYRNCLILSHSVWLEWSYFCYKWVTGTVELRSCSWNVMMLIFVHLIVSKGENWLENRKYGSINRERFWKNQFLWSKDNWGYVSTFSFSIFIIQRIIVWQYNNLAFPRVKNPENSNLNSLCVPEYQPV